MKKVASKVKEGNKKSVKKESVKTKETGNTKKVKPEKPISALKAKRAKIPTFPPPKVTFMDKAVKGEIPSCFGFFEVVIDEETGEAVVDEKGVEKEVLNQEKMEKFLKDFDSYIDLWFEDQEGCNLLNDYLGMNKKDYKAVLANPTYIEELVVSKNESLQNKFAISKNVIDKIEDEK